MRMSWALFRPSAAILAASFVSGCVAYEPKPLVPADELATLRRRSLETFAVDHAEAAIATPAHAAPFDLSDGLNEEEVVAVALSLNTSLVAKRFEAGEGRALLVSAGIWPNPQVGLGVRPGAAGAVGYTVDADVLFALLRPGESDAKIDVAAANLDRIRLEIVAAEWRVVAETRRRYLAVLAREQQMALFDREVAFREILFDLSKRRKTAGEGTDLDISLAELELAEVRRDQREAAFQIDVARRELNQVLGLPVDAHLVLSASGQPLHFRVYTEVDTAEVDRRLMEGRFELRAAEAAYAKAESELRLAVAGQFPRVSVGPTYGRESEGTHYVGFGISVEVPLFDRNQGPIAEAEARRERARAEYAALLQELRGAAHGALALVRRAHAEVDAQERDLLPLVERSRNLFERAFQNRDIGVFEWVSVQQRMLKVRQGYLDALISYQNAVLEFEATTGLSLAEAALESRPESP